MLPSSNLFTDMMCDTFEDVSVTTKTSKLSGIYNIDFEGPFLIFYKNQPRMNVFVILSMTFQTETSESKNKNIVITSKDKTLNFKFSFRFQNHDDYNRFERSMNMQMNSLVNIVLKTNPYDLNCSGQFMSLLPGNSEPEKCFAVVQKSNQWEFQLHTFSGNDNDCLEIKISPEITIMPELEITKLGGQSTFCQSFLIRNISDKISNNIHIKCGSIQEMLDFVSKVYSLIILAESKVLEKNENLPQKSAQNEAETKPIQGIDTVKSDVTDESSDNGEEITILQKEEEISPIQGKQNKSESSEYEEEYYEDDEVNNAKIENQNEIKEQQTILNQNTEDHQEMKVVEQKENEIIDEIKVENDTQIESSPKTEEIVSEQIVLPPDYYTLSKNEFELFKFTENKSTFSKSNIAYKEDQLPKVEAFSFDLTEPAEPIQQIKTEPIETDLENFVSLQNCDLSEENISEILYDSFTVLEETPMPQFSSKPVFEGLRLINEAAFEKMPSEFDLDVTKIFNSLELQFNKTTQKPCCPFLSELQHTVQSLRISGISVHREEQESINLALLVASLFYNSSLHNDFRSTILSMVDFAPSFEKILNESANQKEPISQIFSFAVNSLNTKMLLPILRAIRRNEQWQKENYDISSYICEDFVLEECSNILEPLLMYHTFVLSPITKENFEKIFDKNSDKIIFASLFDRNTDKFVFDNLFDKNVRPAFCHKKLNNLPRLKENSEEFISLIIDVLFDGIKTDQLDFIKNAARKHKISDLEVSLSKSRKIPKKQRVRAIIGDGIKSKQLVNWVCIFSSSADEKEFYPDSTMLDKVRTDFAIKSIYMSLK